MPDGKDERRAQFTFGPWEVDHNRIVTSGGAYGKQQMHIADLRGWGHLTGKGSGGCAMPDGLATVIQEANARVIAAAPEMYTLLAWLLANVEMDKEADDQIAFLLERIDGAA